MKKQENNPRQIFSYSPTRLEYFAAFALQGLVTGRSEKDVKKSVRAAVELAHEMETAIDS